MDISGNIGNGTRKRRFDCTGNPGYHLDPGTFKGYFITALTNNVRGNGPEVNTLRGAQVKAIFAWIVKIDLR